MSKYKNNRSRAISPVIATVILVAVAITVAVAVAYWMSGIAGQYTKFEKVEIQSGWSIKDTTNDRWIITMELKNTGSATSTIIRCFINDVPLNSTAGGYDPTFNATDAFADDKRVVVTFDDTTGMVLASGTQATIQIYIAAPPTFGFASLTSGTTVNVKLHSAGGMDYIKLIELV